MERHAIYYVPPVATLWWKLGSQWLSNSPDGFDSIQEFRGIDRLRREQLIRKPAGYGWHATLVAPFHLRADRTQEEFSERLRTVAAHQRPFELKVRRNFAGTDIHWAYRPVGIHRCHAVR
jgi:hypothetical protein